MYVYSTFHLCMMHIIFSFCFIGEMSIRLRRIALYVVSVITNITGSQIRQIRLWSFQLGLFRKKTSNIYNHDIDIKYFITSIHICKKKKTFSENNLKDKIRVGDVCIQYISPMHDAHNLFFLFHRILVKPSINYSNTVIKK
jgi:hypothetical protein